jgi:hypothetical protein
MGKAPLAFKEFVISKPRFRAIRIRAVALLLSVALGFYGVACLGVQEKNCEATLATLSERWRSTAEALGHSLVPNGKSPRKTEAMEAVRALDADVTQSIASPKNPIEFRDEETQRSFEGMQASERLKGSVNALPYAEKFLVASDLSALMGQTVPKTNHDNYQDLNPQQAQAARTLVTIANELTQQNGIPSELKIRIASSFIENYAKLTGRTLGQLTKAEAQSLSVLKDWALRRSGFGP